MMKYVVFAILAILVLGYTSNIVGVRQVADEVENKVTSEHPTAKVVTYRNYLIPFYVSVEVNWSCPPKVMNGASLIENGKEYSRSILFLKYKVINISTGGSKSSEVQ